MTPIREVIKYAFVLFGGWITAALAVLIALVTLEYTILGSFSWNFRPEIESLIAQNATPIEIATAEIHAKDVADMQILSRVVISLITASFFMLVFLWHANCKDMAAKGKIETDWANTRSEISVISDNIRTLTKLINSFLKKNRSGDPFCNEIVAPDLAVSNLHSSSKNLHESLDKLNDHLENTTEFRE